ncbi:MAG: helix-turn-helix domain-containing protein [Candidatus Nitrosopolaris sp.]
MTYKFRIYPNDQQIAILEEIVETCRLLYNQSLEQRLKDKGDHNAALNILKLGSERTLVEREPLLVKNRQASTR